MSRMYISQGDWVDAIMGLVANLDDEGKQELYDRMEDEVYYKQPTRVELEEKISELEDANGELEDELQVLKVQLQEG